jgi:maltose O-acetyltransferase
MNVTIGDNVFIGSNVILLKGVSIGRNSVIGNGSIVTRSIPENVIAAGVPCRINNQTTSNIEERG